MRPVGVPVSVQAIRTGIFTKVMKPIVEFLRRLDIRIIIYLEDMFSIDKASMRMSLPEDKIPCLKKQIIQKCQKLITTGTIKARNLSEIIALLTSPVRAVLPTPLPLHYRQLQMTQAEALLRGQSYEVKVTLTMDII